MRAKHVRLFSSLKYGWRLTFKHFNTLVPGSALFYAPELAGLLFGWQPRPGAQHWAVTLWHSVIACGLLWHALQLSDQETRASRLHEATLPAPGYVRRFIASTALFWGGLFLLLWPVIWVCSGVAWPPDRGEAVAWLWRPWAWNGEQAVRAAWAALLAVPAMLWTVYGWFHGYYVADEGQDAWPSMLASFEAVKGAFWKTVAFLGVIGAINAAGYALYVIGVFVAFPVTLMATTYVHLELKDQTWPKLKPKPKRQAKRPGRGR